MVIRVSDKKKNYSKVTKLLVKPKYYSLLDTVCGKGSIVKDILEEKDEIDLDIDITDDFFDIDK